MLLYIKKKQKKTCHIISLQLFLLFYGQSGEASQWRVWSQSGLPQLVLFKGPLYWAMMPQNIDFNAIVI